MKRSKQWIPITLSLSLIAAGCRGPSQEAVWVDLSAAAQVLAAESAIDWPNLSADAVSAPATNVRLPGVPSSVVDREVVAARRADALELLQDQLRDTQVKLQEAYRVQLRAAARLLAADLRESLREKADSASEASIAAIASILERSADYRGPRVVRLALLAGWPDDGRSDFVRFAAQRGPVEESWDAEADRLRTELQEHDAQITRQVEAILSQFQGLLETERATNEARIQQEITKADEQAARLARERFSETAKLTLPRLLGTGTDVIAGRGETTLAIPGAKGEAVPDAKPTPFPIPYDALRSRLDIWLSIRGYKLATRPDGVADRTGEFIAWINQP
ncbi:MAG: hypothetical protein ABIV13_07160 [Fimbriimonadales bacterium]